MIAVMPLVDKCVSCFFTHLSRKIASRCVKGHFQGCVLIRLSRFLSSGDICEVVQCTVTELQNAILAFRNGVSVIKADPVVKFEV